MAESDGTLNNLGSTYSVDNHVIYDGLSRPGTRIVSFAPILKHGVFPLASILERLIRIGDEAFGRPVEVEFAVRLPADPVAICNKVAAEGYLAGMPLSRLLPGTGLDDALLVAVTEKRSRQEIDGLVEAVARACKEVA